MMIKFIHCSDIRLDEPFQLVGNVPEYIMKSIRNSSFQNLKRVVDDAIEKKVDFIIISGNLFSSKNRNIKADDYAAKQFSRLKEENIYVYYIQGIEDNMSIQSFYKFPDNVIVFSDEVQTYELVTKNKSRVFFHGFSYKEHSHYEYKLDQYPVNEVNQTIHIGILNGLHHKLKGEDTHTEFHIEELNRKLYHYWALGGFNRHMTLNELPHMHYPGKLQATSFMESGDSGYMYVEGDSSQLNATFVPVNMITFHETVLNLSSIERHAVYQEIEAFKQSVRTNGRQLYRLTLQNDGETLIDQQMLAQIKEQIQIAEMAEEQFVWIDDIYTDEKHAPHTLKDEFSDVLHDLSYLTLAKEPVQQSYIQKFVSFGEVNAERLIDYGEAHLKMLMKGDRHED